MPAFSATCTNNPSPRKATANPFGERDLQAKTMRRWEKQQHLWATVGENIRRRCAKNGKAREACMTMTQGVYRTRLREEELGVVTNATVPDVFCGINTWESTLRTTGDGDAVRYLKLGRTTFPYALYSKVTDERRRDAERMINTRIVFPSRTTKEFGEAEVTQQEYIESIPLSFHNGDYYRERLQRFMPLVERDMSHFMVPRAYLELCGQPPPWTTKQEDMKAARKPAPPVLHIPPPPSPSPPSPQQQQLEQQQGRTKTQSNSPYSTLLQDDILGFSTLASLGAGADEENGRGPSIEISTTRVLFLTRPGELAHGTVTLKNTGTTTVYYSLAPIQPRTALDVDDDDYDDAHEKNVKNASKLDEVQEGRVDECMRLSDKSQAKDIMDFSCVARSSATEEVYQSQGSLSSRGDRVVRQKGVSLRSLAVNSAESKSFFYLSAESDGVVLPEDEVTLPFAVRASFTGRFMMYYELLMIPVISPHVILEMCAIVYDLGSSLRTISQPVMDALEAKAATDVQRVSINALVANGNVYEAVEIAKATDECIAAAEAMKKREESMVAKWRKAWLQSNYSVLRLPFNRAVYERMSMLYQNLLQTMCALGQPLHLQEWDGSVQTLRYGICRLRDAPTRNTLREGLDTLLCAAKMSERDSESLDLLLRRVAGVTAFSALAQRMGVLEESVALALGLRVPRAPTVTETPAGSRSGVSTAGVGLGRKGAGGNVASGAAGRSHSRSVSKGRGSAAVLDSTLRRSGTVDESSSAVELVPIADALTDQSVRQEYDTCIFTGMRRLVGDTVDRLCAAWDNCRCTIEAACDLPLLDITMNARRGDIHVIQNTDDIEVDAAVDIAPPKKKK